MIDLRAMHLMKYYLWFIVPKFLNLVTGQKYNLTGSSEFANLGEAFTWTCGMFVPTGETVNAVQFKRNAFVIAAVGRNESHCTIQSQELRYTYDCLSNSSFTLTIPAENMNAIEQGTKWQCDYVLSTSYRSPDVTLNIRINVYNVSLNPNDSSLAISEYEQRKVLCEVNSNAFPVPTITWFLGSTDVTNIAGTETTSIIITGNRTDNTKTLQCRATNSKEVPKTASTILNVEYPPNVNTLSKQIMIKGKTLNVSCTATSGNPSSTTFYWTKVDNTGFRQDGAILKLNNIQINNSGIYTCTAENSYSNEEKGTNSQTMDVIVYYPPMVDKLSQLDIIEEKPLSVNCTARPGNPSSITFYWFKVGDSGFRQNGATLNIPNIQRNSSGTYKCTAENNYGNGEMGTHSQSMVVNVYYPPMVDKLSKQDITEGKPLSINCTAIPGNPSSITFYWTIVGNSRFRQNGTTLHLPNIQRNSSGTYQCTAENNYGNGKIGTHSQLMVVNVQYTPAIEKEPSFIVNESEKVVLTREIDGNPLSNVNWFKGTELLKNQPLVSSATYTIEEAKCKDTWNFTLTANNGIGSTVKTWVELIVNCKPRSYKTNYTLGVTDATGIALSTIVIAYPEPFIRLEYENGTESNQMMKNIIRNAVNNFTIHISQAVVNHSDFGVYNLKVWNSFGEITLIVNVIPQRKPNVPGNIQIVCEETRARVQWKPSFNGGDPQLFTVIASNGQQSSNISDRGENVTHYTFVEHLQPSTMYVFYVSAHNSHGFISSEKISCMTLAESSEKLSIIIGSAAAGGLTLAIVVIVVVILFRRYTNTENQAGKSQRFENDLVENESVDDDGLKDNILYVSADPRENEKHEAAVYAAVNKKDPSSNNNSTVYAEVKKNGIKGGVKEGAICSDVKPKKGFFKKDGKVKKEKRQKRKQEVADVYENSDDIAMTANPDNVYSNTNHHNDSTKEQQGYKNKDGLLYVEVQFDKKAEERNPVIHGDDEKTDYATVEFPMPSSSHDKE